MMLNNQIIIYTSSVCMYCYKAKSLLKKKEISFNEVNIDLDLSKRDEMISRSLGRTSVPQIFFGDQHIGGYDELIKIEKNKGLEFLNK